MSEKKKTPRNIEFICQLAVIFFLVLGGIFQKTSLVNFVWIFWALAGASATIWVVLVKKQNKSDEKIEKDE